MRVHSGGGRPIRWDAAALWIAVAVVGLMAIGVVPPVLAHAADHREHVTRSDAGLRGRDPAMTARAPRMAATGSAGPPLDTAIRMLFCLEARGAIQRGELSRQLVDWILHNAHRCQDERLLPDTFGF